MTNFNLSACHVQSICEYLGSPNGIVEIHYNAPGCNSQEEVIEACDTAALVKENVNQFKLSISPNPVESKTLIEYTIQLPSPVTLIIFDLSGREVVTLIDELHQQREQSVVFDASQLKPGIYFCTLKTNENIQIVKIIKI
jgi:hypothetical protein